MARCAVDLDEEFRRVGDLLDVDIHRAAHQAQLAGDGLRDLQVLRGMPAADLHVDLRRHAEIEDLRDHVGRLEIENRIREAPVQRQLRSCFW